MHVFAVYDKAVGAYMPPFFARSRGEAMRSFMHACASKDQVFAQSPGDYTLFFLAVFDDAAGTFDVPDTPERCMSAQEAIAVLQRE